jgi:alanine racemase
MDLLMVDLGPGGGPGDLVEPGDAVVLFGAGGPSAVEVSALAESIPYELVCGVGNRVPRVYLNRERERVLSQ